MPIPQKNFNTLPEVNYFGTSLDDNQQTLGIETASRRKHLYILGKTGMGKTTLIENLILQDIYNGGGLAYLDPHGDSIEYILDRIPEHRFKDVVYLNPSDTDFPIGLNILEAKDEQETFLIAAGLMDVFKKIWSGVWSSRMEYILNNTLLALLEQKNHSLLSIVRLLTDTDFREQIVKKIQDPVIKSFWINEFAKFNARYRQEAVSPILNKIGQFLSSTVIRNILGQVNSTIDLQNIMDQKKILLVNVSKGKLGEENSNLLGSLILAKIQTVALARVNTQKDDRTDFYLYVDEFQNFTNDSFGTILSEARKFNLGLVLAHQYIAQLTESGSQKIKNAIFGNVGNWLCFKVSFLDAKILSQEFSLKYSAQDFVNLKKGEIIGQISTDSGQTNYFKANTILGIFEKLGGSKSRVINFSRSNYGKQEYLVKQEIEKQLLSGLDKTIKNQDNKKPIIQKNNSKMPEGSLEIKTWHK